jgi:hypothetical protein
MAVNNWRYVVTWGYMTPNGTIVEEKQFVPWTTTSPVRTTAPWANVPQTNAAQPINGTQTASTYFPRAEAYGLQAQWYANQWNNAMANAYSNIANNLGRYSTFANNALNNYDSLLNYIQNNERGLQNVAGQTYNTLVWDIQNQRDYINRTFWPEWTLTQEVNRYYDDLWNYLATDAGRQAANIAAQWMHSWASLWAIRAQQNEAYNESFGRYVQAKEQEINAKQQIASNLINYMSALRQEYWDTTNQYIIDLYKRANDMYNSVAQSAAWDMAQYNNLLATYSWGWSGGSSSRSTSTPTPDSLVYVDNAWNVVRQTADWKQQAVQYWPWANFPEYGRTNNSTNTGRTTNNSGNNIVIKAWQQSVSRNTGNW